MNVNIPRILMFPWLGYGHITPYFELAKKLTTRGFYIYLCSTPATLSCIESEIPRKSIELIPLPLEVTPDLPENFHTTYGLPPHLMETLREAFHNSIQTFSAIMGNLKPDLLIFDFLQPWAPLVAESHQIPSAIFITSSSVMTSFMFHHFKNPDTVFPSKNVCFRDYESRFMDSLLKDARDEAERRKGSIGVEKSCIVLIKGCREIDGKYIDYVSDLVGKKFFPVGPLVQEPIFNDDGGSDILAWLDTKEAKSTVFVSFGTEYFLSEADFDGIANGLLLSNVNFIWAVRFSDPSEKKFPEGFLDMVGDRGMILEGWCPQIKILAHSNIGGFVSHCGWNSVIESIKIGVPIIALPMHLDQPINARLVEEIGVGKEVLRDGDGRLHGKALAGVIKHVVVEEEGEYLRRNVAEMKAKLESKGDEEIDEVAEEILRICCAKTST